MSWFDANDYALIEIAVRDRIEDALATANVAVASDDDLDAAAAPVRPCGDTRADGRCCLGTIAVAPAA